MARIIPYSDFLTWARNPNLLAEASFSGVIGDEYAMILYAQACLESGRFTSSKYNKDGNMFGMKASVKRKKIYVSTNVKPDGIWPEYRDQLQSLADRINWDVYNRIVYINFEQYAKQVQGQNDNGLKYAEDPDYVIKWYGWIKTVFDEAGMLRPFVSSSFGLDNVPAPDPIGTPAPEPNPGSGISWKVWAPLAGVAAIVMYLIYSRD